MAEQLTFDLVTRPSLGRGDFFVSSANELAVARLDMTATWPNLKLVLVGPEGAGKTHLAQVWAKAEGAVILEPDAVADFDTAALASPVVVDDADRLTPESETALFHLHNHAAALGQALLLTARTPPSRWTTALPDLRSRMEAAEVARIGTPDDALLAAVLVKNFSDRGVVPPAKLVPYLVTHMERSFAAAEAVVAELDRKALAERRAITRHLATQLFVEPEDPQTGAP